jgi:hypothetical protein
MEGMLALTLPVVLMPAFLLALSLCAQAYEECGRRVRGLWCA